MKAQLLLMGSWNITNTTLLFFIFILNFEKLLSVVQM